MRLSTLVAGLAALTLAATAASQKVHPDEFKLKPRIDEAIAKGVERLLNTQIRDGSWGVEGNQLGGQAGLCTYALLKSGVSPDHPSLQRAFAFLDNITPDKTYSVGCMLLAYGASPNPGHKARMRELLETMLRIQHRQGTWAYPHGGPDLSNTQYAALGLWAADKAGLKVPADVWKSLIDATMLHQESYHMADIAITGRTGVGKREVAGFQYRANGAKNANNATGTMTTAGISILKICEIGLGKKMSKKQRREVTRSIQGGLSWMDANFSVTKDQQPGRGGRWLLYYLYGMERVGGLTQQEQFGGNWWYIAGAPEVLRRQKGDGGWGRTYDTCFALLFLRRATRLGPVTGGSGAVGSQHLFAAGKDADDVRLAGAGQQPLMLYIKGFGPALQARHNAAGLRVMRVEYVEGDRVLGQVAGDPTRAWHPNDTFLHRCTALAHGTHKIKARIELVDPKVPPGETNETEIIESPVMDVRIRDVLEPWMEGLANMQKANELKESKFEVIGSSNAKTAANAADGMTHTNWLCAKDDKAPTLTFEFPDAVKMRRLILTQPFEKREDIQRLGLIRRLEVTFNNEKSPTTIDMHPNPLAPTEHEFSRPRKVRRMVVKVVERGGKKGLPVGFSEIVLEGKRR